MRSMFHEGGAFRTLWSWEAAEYLGHLTRLSADCRRARFHRAMSNDGLALHVERVFQPPETRQADEDVHVIGWFLDGALRGAAEVAVFPVGKGERRRLDAEAAFAVEEEHRGQGVGRELMHRAALYARNRGAATLHIATERDNQAMLRLAMGSGATFEINAMEADGVLRAEPRTMFSILLETAEEDVGVAFWAWDRFVLWCERQWRAGLGRKPAVAAGPDRSADTPT